MLRCGFVGWRGLVGSVLMERMRACADFEGLECTFFSTSDPGGAGPQGLGFDTGALADARDLAALGRQDVVITCQGGDYSREVHPRLRERGWQGYWIDAASALRMEPSTVLVLDPVNAAVIERALAAGRRDFCGANCTVSLMLMALAGLFAADEVEWLTSMTYQAASGAGARNMLELVAQMRYLGAAAAAELDDPAGGALAVDRRVGEALAAEDFPRAQFGAPLAASLLPWIDRAMPGGQSREEWKGAAEGNKILARETAPVPIDGICVRVGAMRCHAQAFTVKLRRDLPIERVEALLGAANEWVEVIPNEPEETLARLTPAAVAGSLRVPIGRLRKLAMGPEYLAAFTVGDQLLWGAAEPLRRMLRMLRAHLGEEPGAAPQAVA